MADEMHTMRLRDALKLLTMTPAAALFGTPAAG
jgi:hypothetical protein